MIKVEVEFEDCFSFAKLNKTANVTQEQFDKMQKSIGQIVHRFENNIHWELKVINIKEIK